MRRSRYEHRSVLAAAATIATVAVFAIAGCGGDGEQSAAAQAAQGRQYVVEFLRARQQTGDRAAAPYSAVADLLPNVIYRRVDGTEAPLTDLVVVGHFVAVEPSHGYTVPGGDAPGGVPSDFDDPAARWWTATATFAVDHAIGGEAPARELRVGIVVGPPRDFPMLSAGLLGLGQVVLFLEQGSPVFAADSSDYSIYEDGNFLATVTPDGALGLPAFEPARAVALLGATPTLAELERAAAAQPRTITSG